MSDNINKSTNEKKKSKRVYFNIHIPKTAGWLFWDILKLNFGRKLRNAYTPTTYEFFSKEAVEWLIRQYSFICYTSHAYRLGSMPTLDDTDIIAMSFVRDPVKKFLSYYFYSRQIKETNDSFPTKTYTLTDFLNRLINDPEFSRLPLDVSQEEFIRGSLPSMPIEDLVNLDFGTYHLFPTERFDDAMICLEKLYPEDFKDCSYGKRSNESKKDQEVTEEDYKLIEQLPWIEKDRELHAFSFQYIDKLLETLFPSSIDLEEARKEFKLRCDRKRENVSKARKKHTSKKITFIQRIKAAVKVILRGTYVY